MTTLSLTFDTLLLTKLVFSHPVTMRSCDRDMTFAPPPSRAVSDDVDFTKMMPVVGLLLRMVEYTNISGWKTRDPQMRDGMVASVKLV